MKTLLAWFLLATTLPAAAPAPLLLISLDGFRWDYCALHPAETPNLRRLIAEGVTAKALIPVYPTNTFPNHYSIVTGLYPSHHGVINNHMFDPGRGRFFHYNQTSSAADGAWWGGEPIWVTAGGAGYKTACSFWPGSEAEIGGMRPTFWKPYDYSVPFERRLDELIGWLTLPKDQRPIVTTFYLEEVNGVGHRAGPDSPELTATIKTIDAEVGLLLQRVADAGVTPNVVVVSDHGMTAISPERVVVFEDYIDLATAQIDFDETSAGLRPITSDETAEGIERATAALVHALERMPHAKVFRARDLPARLHIDATNPRVPPVWIMMDEGWLVLRRAVLERARPKFLKGQHGYDPAFPSMHGIFIAQGPAFRSGVTVDAIENVHIYNLMCAALGLHAATNDGDARLVKAALKK